MAKKKAPPGSQELFGGPWTEEKLVCLKKYLEKYSLIFAKNVKAQYYSTHYVDAFAGTGYIPKPEDVGDLLFPEMRDEAQRYTKGSALRALEVSPGFDHYLFIENDDSRAKELEVLKQRFPDKAARIEVQSANANEYLAKWTRETNWKTNRAVVFLDPFGMEVKWELIKILADTKAIDLWLLFPFFAANRMLVRRGNVPEAWARRLTQIFGTQDWQDEFYRTESGLIEGIQITTKIANENKIKSYFVRRLESIFFAVADPPLVLRNENGAALFLFCFAAGNKAGGTTGLRIARHIIGE